MMMFPRWGGIIPARWSKIAAHFALALIVSVSLASGAVRKSRVKTSRHTPRKTQSPAVSRSKKRSVRQSPARSARTENTGSPLKQALAAMDAKQYGDAVRQLTQMRAQYPALSDYFGYWLASAYYEMHDRDAVLRELEPVWKADLASPHAGNAAVLAGRAYVESRNAADAIRVLRERYSQLPQPAGDAVLASAYEAANDLTSAAVYLQRVYYLYPASQEAAQAANDLGRVKGAMGDAYPPPTAQMMLQRADRWRLFGDNARARSEYESIISRVAGADRDIARVRLGALEFQSYQTSTALAYMKSLDISPSEADAERLYWIVECARRLERDSEMMDAVGRLGESYPKSNWRLKAIVTAGNRYLVQHQPEIYEPLFQAGSESFGNDPQSEYCHWKITWRFYLNRRPDAAEMLRTHLLNFPGSERDSAALYYLGRLAQDAKDYNSAKAYYSEILERYPNHYYAWVADERLTGPGFFGAASAPAVTEFLNKVVWPVRRPQPSFEPTRTTQLRLARARLLNSAGLDKLAEQELRFGAKTDGQPQLIAMRMAEELSRSGSAHQAMKVVKSLVPGFLSIPLESTPGAFWKLLFPLPYRGELERNARQQGLDPFLVAGLIRQESEFNPGAISPANAYGLTQVMPSTGRLLARRLGQRRFRPAMLLRPDFNLKLGTIYLRQMYDQYAAAWEQTLAAYNAGGSRVQAWSGWGAFREPSEFVETIPFTETRNYVFAVLRNAQMYRLIYGSEKPVAVTSETLSTKSLRAKGTAVTKRGGYKRTPVVRKHRRARRHR
jgi:soluble lytic murein transglycosylase